MKNILITGCAGYIGSICTSKLLKDGYKVFGFDNLSTGHIETVQKLKQYGDFEFIKGDLKRQEDIKQGFQNRIDAVVHFAGLSQIDESQKFPMKYYENNVLGSVNLFGAMLENNVKKIVFSSSAAIYGIPTNNPITEDHPKNPISTYGMTKLIIENILSALDNRYQLKSAKLRYFNAIGASDDGVFQELHNPETHLIPNVLKCKNLKIYGKNYNTPDGTCIRDYIDVEDLSDAHVAALKYIDKNNCSTECNLGTKTGYSVLEIIKICEEILNKKIEYTMTQRRESDPDILVADNSKAQKLLNWKLQRTIKQSIKKVCFEKRRPYS